VKPFRSVRFVAAVALLASAFFLTGCATTEAENMSERPWNAPKNWEHGMPTGMMPQH
jgi:uncharacterized lipoprotein YajG